jgi:UDP-glucose 4-epimerase
VNDLAEAHVLALKRLESGGESLAVNLGTGQGYSVKQVLTAVEKATGRPVPKRIGPRRAGDPPALVADPSRAEQILEWKATRTLQDIVASAWKWMQAYSSQKVGGPEL